MRSGRKNFTFGQRAGYRALRAVFYPLSLLPLRALYLISDGLALLAGKVLRYRRRVVRENLRASFPEMTEKERRKIEHDFYSFLGDYIVETVKMISMSESQIRRRVRMEGLEQPCGALRRGRDVTLLLGHYCNWEWLSSIPLHIPGKSVGAQIYHPLSNAAFDRLFMDIRTRFGSENIAMDDTLRRLVEWKRAGIPSITGYIADQAPHLDLHLFTDFFNRDTPVLTGPERIARFLDSEVYFIHISRPKRGYYTLRFIRVTDSPKNEPLFEITRAYFRMLEDNIREAPQYWLWSHRRWKVTREMFNTYWGPKAPAMLSHL